MKLSNLSLAILVALGTAACGGSDKNNNTPQDPQRPQTPQTPQTPGNTNDTSALPKVVDPTGTQVVDQKDLSKQESVGTLQYIRQEGSEYDQTNNPRANKAPASASPYLGVHLDDQNPKLTNIVLARQNLIKTNGEPVKAQFAGGTSREPLTTAGAPDNGQAPEANLQVANFANVDVLGGAFKPNVNTAAAHTADTVYKNRAFSDGAKAPTARDRQDTDAQPEVWNKTASKFDANAGGALFDGAKFDNLPASGDAAAVSAIRVAVAPKDAHKDTYGNASYYKKWVAATKADAGVGVVAVSDFSGGNALPVEQQRRYGGNLVWWSSPNNAFETVKTRAGSVTLADDAKEATTGLVRIGGGLDTLGQETKWSSADNKWVDAHKTSTRIFGRYHLAFARDGKVNPVTLNTFVGASSFISEVALPSLDNGGAAHGNLKDAVAANAKAKSYSIGAVPGSLQNVQYGRVTTNLDVDLDAKTYGDGFMHAPYRKKGADDSVDNYFYRGTNATTVAEMAALPTDKKLTYHGHALMYGIDNSYHGGGQSNLPNAFSYGGGDGQLGLGNFVEATADLATKKLTGTVYNAWLLDQSKAAITKDVLVDFSGDIVGNSAFGSADRRYVAGNDKADFRASFFGDKAEEIGGSFNTVQSIPANGSEAFGSAYANGDWGGVFGAKQAGTGNTFQGDDGANVYTGLSN